MPNSSSGAAAVALPNQVGIGKRNIMGQSYQNSSGGHAHALH